MFSLRTALGTSPLFCRTRAVHIVHRLSWILGVAALAGGCKGQAPATEPDGDSPAPQIAPPAEPAQPVQPPAPKDSAKPAPEPETPSAKPEVTEPAKVADNKDPAPAQDPAPSENPEPSKTELSSKAMMAKIQSLRTTDKQALDLLAQAQTRKDSSAKSRALAANARGEKLFTQPERAERFFTWAQTHYQKHPLAPYNRAKLAAIRGDIAQVKAHLNVVKERRGKKLLSKVSFDPTFALVHDDPEVRSLIRSAR